MDAMKTTMIPSMVLLSMFIFSIHTVKLRASNTQDPLAYARSLGEQGNIDEAVEQYLIYYENNPKEHIVLQWISNLYEKNGRIEDAIQYTEKNLVSGDRSLMDDRNIQWQCDRLLDLWQEAGAGKILHALGKADGIELAEEHYRAMIEDSDTEARMLILAQLVLGNIETRSENNAEARLHYLAVLDLISPPANEWEKTVNRTIGRIFITLKWLDEALYAYRNSPYWGHLMELGNWLKQEGRGYEMLELYKNYLLSEYHDVDDDISNWYDDEEISGRIIHDLVSLGQGVSFVEYFQVAIAEHPDNPRLYRNYGCLLFQVKRCEEGVRELEKYLSVPDKVSASDYQWAGDLCDNAGMIDKAIQFYEKACDTEVTDRDIRRESMRSQMAAPIGYWKTGFKVRLLKSLGTLYMKQNRWADAEACFKEAVDLQPSRNEEETQVNLAVIWKNLGEKNLFVEELKSKVSNNPSDIELRVKYGQALLDAEKLNEAVEQFEQAVELSSKDLSIRLKYADALARNKQNAKAIAEYEKVLYLGLKRDKSQFHRGKGGDETEPWTVLYKLAEFCLRVDEKDRLLEIHYNVLQELDSPENQWHPSQYQLERILRDITEILEAKGQYNRIAELWLEYHKETTYYARNVINDRIRYLDLKPLVKQLHEITTADPNDQWGWFILADMLFAENRDEEAVQIYSKLLAEIPSGDRINHDLIDVFERLNRYDLKVEACKKNMDGLREGSKDYGRGCEQVARVYLKLGDKDDAANYYRKALHCDASETERQQYLLGLFKATDGREGSEKAVIIDIKPGTDLKTMRLQAESLLHQYKNYSEARILYEQILEKAPTDIESMVLLGESYEGLGMTEQAVALYEMIVFESEINKWVIVRGDFRAGSKLERIYYQNHEIKKLVKLYAVIDSGSYYDLRRRLQDTKEQEDFHRYVMEQFEQTPNSSKLRLFLASHYAERMEPEKAFEILEQLKSEWADKQGNVRDIYHAMQLADGYEQIGKYNEALAVLSTGDYENDPDRNGWIGERLMRLYTKTGKSDKALETCRLRLKKDPEGYRTIEIAEQFAQTLLCQENGDEIVSLFLEDIKTEIPTRNYKRFNGAVKAYLASHSTVQRSVDNAEIISLLKEGRIIEVPGDCRSFTEFLEQLAYQADTIARGSFITSPGLGMNPPRTDLKRGSVFEILAAALNGKDIDMHITQDGFWEFNYSGDETRKISYIGTGGVICKGEGFMLRSDRKYIYSHPQIIFNPALETNVVSVQWTGNVLEAVDDRQRQIPAPQIKTLWGPARNLEVNLNIQDPPSKSITKLRVKMNVAIASRWATFKIDRLDHNESIVLEKDGVKIQVAPMKEIKRGSEQCWQIPIEIHRENINLESEGITQLKDEIYLIDKDGQRRQLESNGSFTSGNHANISLYSKIDAFDPGTTSLFIREPASVEIVPIELTFKDIPIIDK